MKAQRHQQCSTCCQMMKDAGVECRSSPTIRRLLSVSLVSLLGLLVTLSVVLSFIYDERQVQQVRMVSGIKIKENDNRPTNLRIAFIGDSVSRFQYISLCYYLRTGRWLQEDDDNNDSSGGKHALLYAKGFPTWSEFLQGTNAALLPHERQCDCQRPERPARHQKTKNGTTKAQILSESMENRYYSDDERGNYITYISKFGYFPSQGNVLPSQVYYGDNSNDNKGIDKRNRNNFTDFLPRVWQYNWAGIIREHIGKLEPKPEYVVFNAGHHPHDLRHPWVVDGIRKALDETNITGIYRTTTYPNYVRKASQFRKGSHDEMLCHRSRRSFPHCLNVNWTASLNGPEHYYDRVHFKPHVNARMNMQLLEYLRDLE